LRGHLWLGTLALPLIWFHAGFRHGGGLTSALMWMLYVTVLGGWFGAALQHVLPRRLTLATPTEATFDQIPLVLQDILAEADHVVGCYCGPLYGGELPAWRARQLEVIAWGRDRYVIDAARAEVLKTALAAAPAAGSAPLKEFYLAEVRPVLAGQARESTLLVPGRADVRFTAQRILLPGVLHAPLADLRAAWDRRQALLLQRRLQWWMFAWLFVHVPVSYALMALSLVHAVMGLRYGLHLHG
jgi:hypothetical protein